VIALVEEKRMLTGVLIFVGIARRYVGVSIKMRPRVFAVDDPEAAILLQRSCEAKFVRGVFKLLFENFLVSKLDAGWVKGSLVCKPERL